MAKSMNLFLIQDPDNENFLTARYKWSPHMYKARIFTSVGTANKTRAEMKRKIPAKKYMVHEYELTYLSSR